MLQLDARRSVTLVCGSSGTGKSTFALRYLVADTSLACRFAFDPDGEFSRRLALPTADTQAELCCAIEDGFVIFDPHTLFPGRLPEAFAWFCAFVFQASIRMAGQKILVVDEAWKYCTPGAIPDSLANCIQTGRKAGLAMMFCTQRPNRLNESITNEVTELVCFRLQGKNALQRIEDLGGKPEEVASLPAGNWIALNTQTGGELRGKVF